MMQVVEQTRDEKIAMYMKLSKKELVLSHIELEKYVDFIKENSQYINEALILHQNRLRKLLICEYQKNNRNYCPTCLSTNVQEIELHKVCMDCGSEWSINSEDEDDNKTSFGGYLGVASFILIICAVELISAACVYLMIKYHV